MRHAADPQDADRQAETLREAGAIVAPSNAAAPAGAASGDDALRIAMLTYSVRPRGGVVHALEVSGALARRGHDVELFALARPARASSASRRRARRTSSARRDPDAPFDERIARMIEAYPTGLREPLPTGGFDVVHAQDCLSANAALDAARRGRDRPRHPHRPPRRRLHARRR